VVELIKNPSSIMSSNVGTGSPPTGSGADWTFVSFILAVSQHIEILCSNVEILCSGARTAQHGHQCRPSCLLTTRKHDESARRVHRVWRHRPARSHAVFRRPTSPSSRRDDFSICTFRTRNGLPTKRAGPCAGPVPRYAGASARPTMPPQAIPTTGANPNVCACLHPQCGGTDGQQHVGGKQTWTEADLALIAGATGETMEVVRTRHGAKAKRYTFVSREVSTSVSLPGHWGVRALPPFQGERTALLLRAPAPPHRMQRVARVRPLAPTAHLADGALPHHRWKRRRHGFCAARNARLGPARPDGAVHARSGAFLHQQLSNTTRNHQVAHGYTEHCALCASAC